MLQKFKFLFNGCLRREFSSALYITGDKAQTTFAILIPVVDFEKQLENREALERNFKARGLPLDVDRIEERWNFFKEVDSQKTSLELTRAKIASVISELFKDKEKNKDEIEKFKLHAKLVKDDLLNVKEYYYSLEEDTMVRLLDLPNILHEKTPLEYVTFHVFLKNTEECSLNHIEIGEKNDFIEYINPLTYFLKSDAALFEIGVTNYFRHSLQDFGYNQFSNSNFCRSIIVEGCGVNYKEKNKVFMLEKMDNSKDEINRLHLCGSASIYSFMAYFSRCFVQQTSFPLKYFSIGKRYLPVNKDVPRNLFNLSQESVVSVFTATLEQDDMLDDIVKQVTTLYESLGFHFRLAYAPAIELDKAESLRVSIQMYSNHLQEYVEVGNISVYDSYLSKRLLFNYSVNKERKFPKVIAGNVLNFPKLLGCVLENNSVRGESLMNPLIKKYIFV